MTPELEHKLLTRFPQMYKGYYKDKMETCMCWGFSVDDGWYNILYLLSLAIEDSLNYSYKQKLKFKYAFILSRKWNKYVSQLIYWYTPKKIHAASESSWLKLSDEDQKDKKKVNKAIRHMKAGEKLVKKYHHKFLETFSFLNYWYPDTGFEASQVKEKFGTLRFYTGGTVPSNEVDDKIQEYIDLAEKLTETTCEACGKNGQMRTGGWYRVRCFECCEPHQWSKDEIEKIRQEEPMKYMKLVEDGTITEDSCEE